MDWIRDEVTWANLLESTAAVLFMFVDWSVYATRGVELFEIAEEMCIEQRFPEPLLFRACDASTIDSCPHATIDWVRKEDARGKVRLLPVVGVGNGSIVWIHRGHAVAVEMSMLQLGVSGFFEKSRQVLAALQAT